MNKQNNIIPYYEILSPVTCTFENIIIVKDITMISLKNVLKLYGVKTVHRIKKTIFTK
jgi:hypothetical protein